MDPGWGDILFLLAAVYGTLLAVKLVRKTRREARVGGIALILALVLQLVIHFFPPPRHDPWVLTIPVPNVTVPLPAGGPAGGGAPGGAPAGAGTAVPSAGGPAQGAGTSDIVEIEVDLPQTLVQVLLLFALVSIVVGMCSAYRLRTQGEDLLVFQKAILRLVLLLVGLVVLYQWKYGAVYSIAKVVLLSTGASVLVVGLALQRMLQNLGAGMALEIDGVFKKGEFIELPSQDLRGMVVEKSMRATRIVTLEGVMIFVPNSILVGNPVVNHDRPRRSVVQRLAIGTSYDDPPLKVKEALRRILDEEPGVLASPRHEVLCTGYGDFAIDYEIRYWIPDIRRYREINDRVMSRIWYVFREEGIQIPFPIRTLRSVSRGEEARAARERDELSERIATTLEGVQLFQAHLGSRERAELARDTEEIRFEPGAPIVRKGERSDSMYVVRKGSCRVPREDGGAFTIPEGGYFGELGILRREARSADVVAGPEGTTVLRVTGAALEHLVRRNAGMAEELKKVGKERLRELTGSEVATEEGPRRPPSTRELVREAAAFLRPW